MSGWTWRFEAADGSVLEGQAWARHSFPSRADAESWVGEAWRELVAGGIESVSLLHDGELVYGSMSLRPVE